MNPPASFPQALDELSTLAPHRVRGVPGAGTAVDYSFCTVIGTQPVWGNDVSGAFEAIRRENALDITSSTAAPYSVSLFKRGEPINDLVRSVGASRLEAYAGALVLYLRRELVRCAT